MIPLDRYPGLPALFLDFVAGRRDFYPDPPTLDAALARGKEQLARRGPARLTPEAFRFRLPAARRAAEDLSAGRAVAVLAGHQIGLFTGPLFTLVKAFDAIRVARELSRRGLPAVPVFWALTDDHDLEEIARTARPGPDGPESIILEGADRSNRRPVGTLTLPETVRETLDRFRPDARGEEGEEILRAAARRYAPGSTYAEAFIETLFDLTEPDPLLVLDPLSDEIRSAAARLFLAGLERRSELTETMRAGAELLERAGRAPVVPFRPEIFPFFVIEEDGRGPRRRVDPEDLTAVAARVSSGELAVSADVLTRPVLKSCVLPTAASVLGPSEISYHAQALPLFPLFGATAPVLLPRSLLVLRGPAERRAAEALGLSEGDLLSPDSKLEPADVPGAERLGTIGSGLDRDLLSLAPELTRLDPSLTGALETARRKTAYQLEQLAERMRKAAERKDEVALNRRRRLQTMLLPDGQPAERVYPPLVFLLAYGRVALDAIRSAAGGSRETVQVVDLDGKSETEAKRIHAG